MTKLPSSFPPAIAALRGATVVVKYGGAAFDDDAPKSHLAHDAVLLRRAGVRLVVVHGGGNDVTELAGRLGIPSEFIDGMRRTDAPMLDVATMVLAGRINKDLVRRIEACGGPAVGLSGVDNSLIRAERCRGAHDLGEVGDVVGINGTFLRLLIDAGVIPVIAPLGIGPSGAVYNINADVAAGAIAGALDAELLLFLSNVDGVMVDGAIAGQLTEAQTGAMISSGAIEGGMIPKVRSAFDALDAGARSVRIANGVRPHAIWHALADAATGTTVRR